LLIKIVKGLLIGLLANLCGTYLYIILVIRDEFFYTLEKGYTNGFLGGLIGLGAILNLVVFFFLLTERVGKYRKKQQIYEARGVLLATLLAAIAVIYFEF
jgi:hypothetical protein